MECHVERHVAARHLVQPDRGVQSKAMPVQAGNPDEIVNFLQKTFQKYHRKHNRIRRKLLENKDWGAKAEAHMLPATSVMHLPVCDPQCGQSRSCSLTSNSLLHVKNLTTSFCRQ